MFLAEQVRTVPLWPLSYTSWHPDVPHSNPLHIKIQIYVNDVDPGCGEFAFVPGSHKRTAGPYTRPVFQESMPGHRTFVGAAGTAVMFNAYGWHAAMDNHSGIPRKSIILIYEKLIGVVRELLPDLSESDHAAIMGATARRFLALPGTRQRIGATMDSCQRNIRAPIPAGDGVRDDEPALVTHGYGILVPVLESLKLFAVTAPEVGSARLNMDVIHMTGAIGEASDGVEQG